MKGLHHLILPKSLEADDLQQHFKSVYYLPTVVLTLKRHNLPTSRLLRFYLGQVYVRPGEVQ